VKVKRQSKLLEIIDKFEIDTQEALLEKLTASGFKATQATVSRDIKELKLIKTLSEAGGYKYALPPALREKNPIASLTSLLNDSVESIDYAMNTVVIKCHIGMAQAVCAKLDGVNFKNIVGTLAGDDTIFVLMKTESDASSLIENFNNLMQGR
jgi:transcriptional regulator of arginine metabolism